MGQQAALSGILRGQNKPTSRDSYEAMGQQKGQRNESHPAVEPGHVKNSKSRFQTDRKIPSENEGKSSDFTPYGMAVNSFHNFHSTSWKRLLPCTASCCLQWGVNRIFD